MTEKQIEKLCKEVSDLQNVCDRFKVATMSKTELYALRGVANVIQDRYKGCRCSVEVAMLGPGMSDGIMLFDTPQARASYPLQP